MKTIKTKKSVGIFYVLSCYIEGKLTPHVYNTRECADESRRWAIKENLQPSEISEVELFEEVEEQVPDVGLAWIFFYKKVAREGVVIPETSLDESTAILRRQRHIDAKYECSEIKLLREEF